MDFALPAAPLEEREPPPQLRRLLEQQPLVRATCASFSLVSSTHAWAAHRCQQSAQSLALPA